MQFLATAWIDMPWRDLRQRPEHESMPQLVARDLQVTRPVQYQVIKKYDVDIQWPVAIAGSAAVAAMGVFQRMQPVIQCMGVEVAIDDGGRVEEIATFETDRREDVRL